MPRNHRGPIGIARKRYGQRKHLDIGQQSTKIIAGDIQGLLLGAFIVAEARMLQWRMPIEPIVATSKAHLRQSILRAIESNGKTCSLNHIDVSGITDMSGLFQNSPFNGDISAWDVSNVTDMGHMFDTAAFLGDISQWNVTKVQSMANFLVRVDYCGDLSSWRPQCLVDATTMLTRHAMREMQHPCFYHWLAAMVENRVFEMHIQEFVHKHRPTMQSVGLDALQASLAMQEAWMREHAPEQRQHTTLVLPDLGIV